MSDTNDIDALLAFLGRMAMPKQHAALTALVADRNALREENDSLRSRCKAHQDDVMDRVFALDALRKRVAELEAEPPAGRDRELRERLVCAALTGLTSNSDFTANASDLPRWAINQADAVLAAMRKGEQP